MNPINHSGRSRMWDASPDESSSQRPGRQAVPVPPAGASAATRTARFYGHGTRNFFPAQQLAYAEAGVAQVGAPSASGGKAAARKLATLPDGSVAMTTHEAGQALHGMEGFEIFDASGKPLGKIETGVIDNSHEDCVALTWIDKGELKQNGAVAFALWYLSKHTVKNHVEVRQILNPDLHAYLGRMQPQHGEAEDSWRWSTEQLGATTQAILVAKGWKLTE